MEARRRKYYADSIATSRLSSSTLFWIGMRTKKPESWKEERWFLDFIKMKVNK